MSEYIVQYTVNIEARVEAANERAALLIGDALYERTDVRGANYISELVDLNIDLRGQIEVYKDSDDAEDQ